MPWAPHALLCVGVAAPVGAVEPSEEWLAPGIGILARLKDRPLWFGSIIDRCDGLRQRPR